MTFKVSLAAPPALSVTVSRKTSSLGTGERNFGTENMAAMDDALESVTGYPDTCCHRYETMLPSGSYDATPSSVTGSFVLWRTDWSGPAFATGSGLGSTRFVTDAVLFPT